MNSVARLLVQINIVDRLIHQIAKSDESIARTESGPACHIRSCGRQIILRRRGYVSAGLTGADLSDAAAIDPEVGSDVMLTVAADKHSLNDCNLAVVQSHLGFSWWELQCREYATNATDVQRAFA
jgi:hypothetical protein